MKERVRSVRFGLRTAGVAGATALLVALVVQGASARVSAPAAATAAHTCLVMTGAGDPAFVKNFNPYTATSLPSGAFVQGAFYEPLIVTPEGGKKQVPWLAKSWKWSNGNKTLTLNLVQNATWSDGVPLTSADVVYSITAGKQNKVMDWIGVYKAGSNIKSVTANGRYQVVIKLKTPDSQFIAANLNKQFIVPQHIWSKVKNPATWTNPDPVGSGPFDSISRFTTQDYVLNANTRYWRGTPKVPCLEYVQATSNDAALLLIKSGQVDWTHNFVPNVEKAYESKDPAHFHAFYATTAYPVSLVFDDSKYPYSLVAFRKALSLAINRNDVSKLGEYGYAPPTTAIGLNGLFPSWVTGKVKAQAKQMARYSPAAAKKLLTDAGFTYDGNQLVDPKGNPVTLETHVISGWSDWVASNQIIAKDLKAIGIDASVKLEPDWNSWYPFASTTKGASLMWQNASQGSPYGFYFSNLSHAAYTPPGQDATALGNWAHFWDPNATKLLNQWKTTLDTGEQHQIANKLGSIFLDNLPIVPLFIGPRWSTYSTRYFHGFSSPKDFYGDPIFTTFPDNILSFTRIAPGGKAGA